MKFFIIFIEMIDYVSDTWLFIHLNNKIFDECKIVNRTYLITMFFQFPNNFL